MVPSQVKVFIIKKISVESDRLIPGLMHALGLSKKKKKPCFRAHCSIIGVDTGRIRSISGQKLRTKEN